ncbi:acyl-CoA thioesterase [Conservatibacter flavescens]|uniref:Thioesterase n=1 Tax=Conservatibacter flavescens TaxID=28161 RepID=A0A2M8S2P1_9PAST|nr:acyl-CoA thioesterase [Conservatibacter flavescens]PJG85402.1 thioesterase [Conservatibacter flavescens]
MRKKKHIYCQYSSDYDIQFFDVDSMNIMWHGHYVKYLEMARCAFLESIHYHYDVMKSTGFAWPIVQLNVKYVKPALFRQKIRVHLALVEYETCIRFDYIITDIATGEKLTHANTTQVAVDMQTKEMLLQTPDSWQRAVQNAIDFQPLTKD